MHGQISLLAGPAKGPGQVDVFLLSKAFSVSRLAEAASLSGVRSAAVVPPEGMAGRLSFGAQGFLFYRWSPRGGRACRAARAWAPRSSASRLGRRAGSRLSFETRARQQTQRHRGSGGAPRRVPVGRALLVTLRVVLYGECGSWSRLTKHRFGPGRERVGVS